MSKPVLFASPRRLERAENLKALYDAYDGEKVYINTQDQAFLSGPTMGGCDSDLLITDDFPPVKYPKCIMIWHGIHGGKKIGLDVPGNSYYNETVADRITYVISASKHMVSEWSMCTGLPEERILPLGFPRTDQYVNYKQPTGIRSKLYLFAPTFRDIGETEFPDIDWKLIDNMLRPDEILAVKLHPWVAEHGDSKILEQLRTINYKKIFFINPLEPTTEFLYMADVVITDYSSVMFDALLLNKPIVLFEKKPGYTKSRGMCFKYPFEYSTYFDVTEDGMISSARYRTFVKPRLTEGEIRIRSHVADACDGHACERICKLIDEMR